LEIPKSSSRKVLDKTIGVFSSRVVVNEFPEKGDSVEPEKLADSKSKHVLKVDKQTRPVPETGADKATIVVVCPPLAARDSGKRNQFKLPANDHVVAVNKAGTYSFAYLEPGRYRLISQSANAQRIRNGVGGRQDLPLLPEYVPRRFQMGNQAFPQQRGTRDLPNEWNILLRLVAQVRALASLCPVDRFAGDDCP
jgi:hypothetical protein